MNICLNKYMYTPNRQKKTQIDPKSMSKYNKNKQI